MFSDKGPTDPTEFGERIQSGENLDEKRMVLEEAWGLREARRVFGDKFFGPIEILSLNGRRIPYEPEMLKVPYIEKSAIPELPDPRLMEKCRDLGAIMALRVFGIQPIESMPFRGAARWDIFLPKFLPSTMGQNYLEQTAGMYEYLADNQLLTQSEINERPAFMRLWKENEKLREANKKILDNLSPNERGRYELYSTSEVYLKLNKFDDSIWRAARNLKISGRRHTVEDIMYFNQLAGKFISQENFEATRSNANEYMNDPAAIASGKLRQQDFAVRRGIGKDATVETLLVGRFIDRRSGLGCVSVLRDDGSEPFWGRHYPQGVRLKLYSGYKEQY